MRIGLIAAATILGLAAAGSAMASPCGGPAPKAGEVIAGPVLNVIDGQTLCIALGPTPDQWVEVEMADYAAPTRASMGGAEPRQVLMSAAFSRKASCVATGRAGDHARAQCVIDGEPLARLLTKPEVTNAAYEWR